MTKKILVTGGAGFIGSSLIRYLLNDKSIDVINVDKFTYAGSEESLIDVRDKANYKLYIQCITNQSEILKILKEEKPSMIMHLAAESHVDRSIDNPSDFIRTNIFGTYSLLEAAREYFLSLEEDAKNDFRFHHISTDEVYGDLDKEEDAFTETTPYAPSSPYSASKASSDHLVRAWNRTYSLPTIISNCSNNYGPFQFPEKLIPLTILNAIDGKKIPIYGDGCQIRDWLFVEDHVQALYLIALKGKNGETYNIGGHNEIKNIDVVRNICEILDEICPKDSGSYLDQISFIDDRAGHDKRYAIDASKIFNSLDWKPNETFKTGIRKTVIWYLQNKWWWQSLKRKQI